jgi:hypothetical protein
VAKTVRGPAFLAVMAWRDPPASAQTAATNPDQADTSDPKLGQEATGIWPKREGDAHVFRPRPDGGFDYMGEIVAETWKRRASGAAQTPRLGRGN